MISQDIRKWRMILDYGWGYNEDIGFQWEKCGKTYDLRRKMVGLCWISLGKLELILILGLSISLSMDLFKKKHGWMDHLDPFRAMCYIGSII